MVRHIARPGVGLGYVQRCHAPCRSGGRVSRLLAIPGRDHGQQHERVAGCGHFSAGARRQVLDIQNASGGDPALVQERQEAAQGGSLPRNVVAFVGAAGGRLHGQRRASRPATRNAQESGATIAAGLPALAKERMPYCQADRYTPPGPACMESRMVPKPASVKATTLPWLTRSTTACIVALVSLV